MAISIKMIGSSGDAINYYIKSATQDDYYAKEFDQEGNSILVDPPGSWYDKHGVFAGIVEHEATVKPDDWVSLCHGVDPISKLPLSDNNRVLKESGKEIEAKRVGMDMTFTPHKSVSVLWGLAKALGREDIADTVLRIEREAVEKAIDFAQQHYLKTRVRNGEKQERVPAKAAVAIWQHSASRDGDMNLHHHSVWNNTVMAEDGSMMSMEPTLIFKYQKAIASYYHVASCEGFNKAGIKTTVRDGENVFSIDGIDKDLCMLFSKATARINEAVGDGASKAMRQVGNVSTRPVKKDETLDDMLSRWKDEANQYGFDQKIFNDIFDRHIFLDIAEEDKKESVSELTERLMERISCASSIDVDFEAGVEIQKRGGSLRSYSQLCSLAKKTMVNVSQDEDDLEYYSSRDVVKIEKECLDLANSARPKSFEVNHTVLQKILLEATEAGASSEQLSVINNSIIKDKLAVNIEGVAGAGKSFALKFIAQYYKEIGARVIATSQQAKVKNDLMQSINADESRTLEYLRRKIIEGTNPFRGGDVIFLDEAGMAGHRYFHPVLTAARQAGAILINSGDGRQLLTINGGNLFGTFCAYLGSEEITEVRRQGQHVISNPEEYAKFKWMRDATMHLSKGSSDEAISLYAENNHVKILDGNTQEMEEAAIQEWEKSYIEDTSIMMLASTNDAVYRVNKLAREKLQKSGLVGEDKITVKASCGSSAKETSFAVGDVIVFRKNDKKIGVFDADGLDDSESITNRRSGKIIGIDNGIFSIELGDGKFVTVCKENYWDEENDCLPLQHGYAMTVYSSQGISVNKSIIIDPSAFDVRLMYVALSRHKKDISIYYSKEMLTSIYNTINDKGVWKKPEDMSAVELYHAASKANMRSTEKLTSADVLKYDGYLNSEELKHRIKEEKKISKYEKQLNEQNKKVEAALKEARRCVMSESIAKDNESSSRVVVKNHLRNLIDRKKIDPRVESILEEKKFFTANFRGVLDGFGSENEIFVAGNKIESAVYFAKHGCQRHVACISSLNYNSLEQYDKITLIGSATVDRLENRCPGVRVSNPSHSKSVLRNGWYRGNLPRSFVDKYINSGSAQGGISYSLKPNETYFYKKQQSDTSENASDDTVARDISNLDRFQIVASNAEKKAIQGKFAPEIIVANDVEDIRSIIKSDKKIPLKNVEVTTNLPVDVKSLLQVNGFNLTVMQPSKMAYLNTGVEDSSAVAARFDERIQSDGGALIYGGQSSVVCLVHDMQTAKEIFQKTGRAAVVKLNGWECDDKVQSLIRNAQLVCNEQMQCVDETKDQFRGRLKSERAVFDSLNQNNVVHIPMKIIPTENDYSSAVGKYIRNVRLRENENNDNLSL